MQTTVLKEGMLRLSMSKKRNFFGDAYQPLVTSMRIGAAVVSTGMLSSDTRNLKLQNQSII